VRMTYLLAPLSLVAKERETFLRMTQASRAGQRGGGIARRPARRDTLRGFSSPRRAGSQ